MPSPEDIFERRPQAVNQAELRRVFRPVLEKFFQDLIAEVQDWPLIGATNEDTIRSAYKKQFTLDAIRMVDERLN